MSDDLKPFLRTAKDATPEQVVDLCGKAADRIEALEAQLAQAVEWSDRLAETLLAVNAQHGGRHAARVLKDYRDTLAAIKGAGE